MDALEPVSPPPAVILQVNMQEEQRVDLPRGTGSTKLFSECSSNEANYVGRFRKRNTWTKSVKNSSTPLPICLVFDNSSGFVSDGLNPTSSDVLVNDVPPAGKSVGRSSRRKGKKKGKQSRRSMRKNISVGLESQCNESIPGDSVSVTSVNSNAACLSKHILESSFFEKAISSITSVKDITTAKDDDVDSGVIESSTASMPCTSYSDEMDASEPISSFSQGFSGEGISCTFDENGNHVHPKQNNFNCYDNSSSIPSDQYIASMLCLFDGNWKSDNSGNCRDDVEARLSIKDESGLDSSNGGMVAEPSSSDTSFHRIANSCDLNNELSNDCHISSRCWPKDDVDTPNNTERALHSSQACSCSGFHPVISGKRGRLARNASRKLNGASKFGSANVHGRTVKYNYYSVWQKVQRGNNEEFICKAKSADSVFPQVDISYKGSETRMRINAFVHGRQNHSRRYPCSNEIVGQTYKPYMFCETSNPADSSEICSKLINGKSKTDVRGRPSSGSKQGNYYSRKGSFASEINMSAPSKIHVRQKELEKLEQVNQRKHRRPGLRSHCTTDSQQVMVKPADRSYCCQSEPQQQTSIHMEEETSPTNINSGVMALDSISLMALNSLDQKDIEVHYESSDGKSCKGMHEDLYRIDNDNNRCMNLEAESSHAECSKLDHSPMHTLQKCVTVGGNDSVVLTTSHVDNLSDSSSDESVRNKPNSNDAEVEVLSALPCLNVGTEDIYCSSPEADGLTSKLRSQSHTDKEFNDGLAFSKCHLTQEMTSDELSGFETDLDKIIQAVNDVYKLQPAEGVHPATVGHFADFEEFIHNVSPVIGQIYSINTCKYCSREESIGNLLCSHQIPSISLGSLWDWYEEPGCYGLEVKAEDYCNSKSLHNRCFQFSAYFVPFLSAVQLFSRSSRTKNANLKAVVTTNSEVDKRSNTSFNLGSLPIFSLLLPRPRKEVDACLSDSSSSSKLEFTNRSVRNICLGDKELIFEYFESQQPHHRRPLFEKIKELVRGDTLSNRQLFGDPLKLECLNLHDLHPASWYSVAWYPIYRIPDGNFHAAFLTYHSLGHFVHQSASASSDIRGLTHIVSSVVGLQSYNAKGESWFEPRGSKVAQTEGSSILEERLRMLEQTARAMATASVRKGDQRSVNKQPDYEFFSQRR